MSGALCCLLCARGNAFESATALLAALQRLLTDTRPCFNCGALCPGIVQLVSHWRRCHHHHQQQHRFQHHKQHQQHRFHHHHHHHQQHRFQHHHHHQQHQQQQHPIANLTRHLSPDDLCLPASGADGGEPVCHVPPLPHPHSALSASASLATTLDSGVSRRRSGSNWSAGDDSCVSFAGNDINSVPVVVADTSACRRAAADNATAAAPGTRSPSVSLGSVADQLPDLSDLLNFGLIDSSHCDEVAASAPLLSWASTTPPSQLSPLPLPPPTTTAAATAAAAAGEVSIRVTLGGVESVGRVVSPPPPPPPPLHSNAEPVVTLSRWCLPEPGRCRPLPLLGRRCTPVYSGATDSSPCQLPVHTVSVAHCLPLTFPPAVITAAITITTAGAGAAVASGAATVASTTSATVTVTTASVTSTAFATPITTTTTATTTTASSPIPVTAAAARRLRHILQQPPLYQCAECLRHFRLASSLHSHRRRVHAVVAAGAGEIGGFGGGAGFACFHCRVCGRQFISRRWFYRHMAVVHGGTVPATASAGQGGAAMAAVTVGGGDSEACAASRSDSTCLVCDRSFSSLYFLRDHLRLHTGEQPHECSVCGRRYSLAQSLAKHRQRHHSDEPPTGGGVGGDGGAGGVSCRHRHQCDQCERSFRELATLHNHRLTHSGEKPWPCEVCGKRFRQRITYVVHRRIHTGEMPYTCAQCNGKFRYKLSLKAHKCVVTQSATDRVTIAAGASQSNTVATTTTVISTDATAATATTTAVSTDSQQLVDSTASGSCERSVSQLSSVSSADGGSLRSTRSRPGPISRHVLQRLLVKLTGQQQQQQQQTDSGDQDSDSSAI